MGTQRRPMAAKIESQYFVGPDNGLFTRDIHQGKESKEDIHFVLLTNPQYWLSNIRHVFHRRDIFALVEPHLFTNVFIYEIGSPFIDLILFPFPKFEFSKD